MDDDSEEFDIGWKIVGSGNIENNLNSGTSSSAKSPRPQVYIMDDTIGIAMTVPAISNLWLLAPYVDPGVVRGQGVFMTELAKELNCKPRQLKRRIQDSKELQKIVSQYAGTLRAAYRAVTNDLNLTTLCLFSGPAHAYDGIYWSLVRCRGSNWIRSMWHHDTEIGWLGTGDANLKNAKYRNAFLRHFGALLDEVNTLTLPHHGSEHSFN